MNLLEMLLLSGIVTPIILLFVGIAWGIWEFVLTPKEFKVLRKASIMRRTMAMIFQGNQQIRMVSCVLEKGLWLETVEKKPNRIPILRPSLHTQDSGQSDEEKDEKEEEKDRQDAWLVEEQALRTSFIGKVPTYLVYAGVAIAVNAATVLALGNKKTEVTGVIAKEVNGKIVDQEIIVALPLKPEAIKKHLTELVDQTVIDGIHQDGWDEGFLEGKEMKDWKIYAYMVLGLIVFGALLLFLLKFF